jgi:3-oxoacyl-[acyl-carrier-protein] synthase II
MSRAVITGRGVLSPLGCDWSSFAAAVEKGRRAEPAPFPAALPDNPARCYLLSDSDVLASLTAAKHSEPLASMATIAVRQALTEAGIANGEGPRDDIGLVMNTTFGPSASLESYLERLETSGPRASRPAQFVDTLISMPASRVSIAGGLRGSTAVTGGSSALELALDWVRSGRDGAIVAGGGEYLSAKTLRFQLELARRSGVERSPLAQGAGFVLLEDAARAEVRGAPALGELLGAGAASEPQPVSVPWSADPEGRALACAMRGALTEAHVARDQVKAIALAAGDDASEASELAAIEAVFGKGAASLTLLRPKRLLGEALGASGPLALLTALAEMEAGSTALVNAFEMGGAVTSLALRTGL